jgi:hypothetical protein
MARSTTVPSCTATVKQLRIREGAMSNVRNWRYKSDLQRVAVTAATNWTGLIRRWSPLIWSRASLSGSVRDAGILVAGAEDTRRALCPPRRGGPQCLSLSRAGRRKAPFEPPPLSSDRAFERELVVRSRTSAWGQTETRRTFRPWSGIVSIADPWVANRAADPVPYKVPVRGEQCHARMAPDDARRLSTIEWLGAAKRA